MKTMYNKTQWQYTNQCKDWFKTPAWNLKNLNTSAFVLWYANLLKIVFTAFLNNIPYATKLKNTPSKRNFKPAPDNVGIFKS